MSEQIWTSRRSITALAMAAVAVSLACSGSGSGCGGLAPIPTGRYVGPKTDNAINVRLSPNGINYLNQQWPSLIEMFAPGQEIHVPVPCSVQDPPAITKVVVADQGQPNGSGRMDGKCCINATDPGCSAGIVDVPKDVVIKITGFQLVPVAPDKVQATVSITADTGPIYIATQGGTAWCFGGQMRCSIDFRTSRAAPSSNTLDAEVQFTIDQKWDKLLSFSVTRVDGTKVCGSSGASPKPRCLDAADIDIDGIGTCGSAYCGTFDWDPIKNFVLQQISPLLQGQVQDAISKQSCQACGQGMPACPQLTNAASTCQDGICVDSATNKCVPRFLGVEGRMSPGTLLSGFGVPLDAELDISVAAGSSVSVDQGINIGTRAGALAVKVAPCVPELPMPQLGQVTVPDFDAEAPIDPNTNQPAAYHVGLGVSKQFLDLAMFHAHQSGSLCISMSSATTGLLNTGLFKTFLPSLGKLTTRDGKDAPMMVVLKPAGVPAITIGEGTFDATTKKPIKPLLKLDMPNLTIDFYAMLDDRFVRLFSLTADVSIPLSVIFEGCSSVTPALGDLKQLITNIRTANSEILAEDPKVLADLIPAVIGLAEPAVAGALKPFALPALGAFKLKVNATKGVSNISGTEAYEHLGIYATLMSATAACATAAPQTLASLKRSEMPPAEQMRLVGQPLPWPTAILDVRAIGGQGTAEFAYRIDGGMWSSFLAPNANGELEVSHPAFLLQGRHTIEVRSRYEEEPHGVSAPVDVGFVVDWEAPTVTLTADRTHGVLNVEAHDAVTPKDELRFAYQVGDGQVSSFGPARIVDLDAVEAQGGVTVLVQDGQGNIGRAIWRAPTVALRAEPGEAGAGSEDAALEGTGCAAAGGAPWLWALGLGAGALWRRRRARSQ